MLEILPDYTDDEQEAFPTPIVKPPSYPSGSMTLPKPAVKKHASPAAPAATEAKVTFKGLPPEVKKATGDSSPTSVTKPNESGESDPGYESDSSKSKPNSDSSQGTNSPQQPKQHQQPQQQQNQQQQQQQNKACTLPRRSAKVSSSVQPPSSTLDRRKLRNLLESEAGVTVEIIQPIRVCQTVSLSFFLRSETCYIERVPIFLSNDRESKIWLSLPTELHFQKICSPWDDHITVRSQHTRASHTRNSKCWFFIGKTLPI